MKPTIENIKAAEDLIKRYRAITIEEIEKIKTLTNFSLISIAHALTGFGVCDTCILCKSTVSYNTSNIVHNCDKCIYSIFIHYTLPCTKDTTYYNIRTANTVSDLLKAFKERADYIEKILIENNWKSEK